MNENLRPITTLRPFTRFIYTLGALPTSYLMSMTYEEQLIWLCNYLSQTVIPALNNNGLAIEELQEKYIELKNYVDTYFDNLNLQEEVNNKLDEMAESGELENLISEYIELATTYVYNNVNEMKEATNLVNGSFARTSGFYSYNDGGGAYYKIRNVTNEDIIDNILLFALTNDNTLVAELIVTDEMNVKQFGAIDNDTFDNTTIFNKIARLNISKIKYEGNIFKTNGTIDFLDKENFELDFNCKIHIASSVNPGTASFRLLRCNNVKVNGYDVYSERDKNEPPFGDTTRISPYGSNIYGLVIRSCKNIFIDNICFNNMAIDFVISKYDLDDLQEYSNSEEIYINNYISNNASNNNLIAYSKNIFYNNMNLSPAIDMGDGDHGWYISDDIENLYISNLNFKLKDGHFGVIFQSNPDSINPININIKDSYIKATRLCYNKNDTVMYFNNIVFDDIGTNNDNFVLTGTNAKLIINNSCINNLSRPFIQTSYNSNITINNCIINSNYNGNLFSFTGENLTQILKINDTKIYNHTGYLIFSGSDTPSDIKLTNSYIECNNENCISKRNINAKMLISNTQIFNSHADPGGLIYNSSATADNLVVINCYFKNYYRYIYNATNGIVLNSYLNDTLIS